MAACWYIVKGKGVSIRIQRMKRNDGDQSPELPGTALEKLKHRSEIGGSPLYEVHGSEGERHELEA